MPDGHYVVGRMPMAKKAWPTSFCEIIVIAGLSFISTSTPSRVVGCVDVAAGLDHQNGLNIVNIQHQLALRVQLSVRPRFAQGRTAESAESTPCNIAESISHATSPENHHHRVHVLSTPLEEPTDTALRPSYHINQRITRDTINCRLSL